MGPWVEDHHTGEFKISDVARDDGHAMDQRCRRDEPVANRAWVWHMQPGVALGNRSVDADQRGQQLSSNLSRFRQF